MRWVLVTATAALLALSPDAVRADDAHPRDYFLSPTAPGFVLNTDVYTVGAQASLEHRAIFSKPDLGGVTSRATALASLGFGELSLHSDVRFLYFSVGASVGYRNVWRGYSFPDDERGTRDERLEIDTAKTGTSNQWGYGEARVRMVVPFDDFVIVTNYAVRYEGAPRNTFDWAHTTMHDGGFIFRVDGTFFYRNPKIGAFGPTFRFMEMPRAGRDVGELAGGFTFGTRPGFKKDADLLLLQTLARPGDPQFGFHILRMPLFVLLVYRLTFSL